MKTKFHKLPEGHELDKTLALIDQAIDASGEHGCITSGCRCDALEEVLGDNIDSPNLPICDSCKVHWLLETAAVIARKAIETSKLS